jgi:hypothetical protein
MPAGTVALYHRLVVVAAVAAPLLVPATGASAACRIAIGGDGQSVTVALHGSVGQRLQVSWGDGTWSETMRPLTADRGRAFLRHLYEGAGKYPLSVQSPGVGGCALDLVLDVPYPGGADPESRALLPASSAPASSDDVDEDGTMAALGDDETASMGETRSTPTAVGDAAPTAVGDGGTLGSLVRHLLSRLFGGR